MGGRGGAVELDGGGQDEVEDDEDDEEDIEEEIHGEHRLCEGEG